MDEYPENLMIGEGNTFIMEAALKKAFKEQDPAVIPDGWQAGLMKELRNQALVDSVKEHTGSMLLRFSCAAAAVAAALVLYFSVFFDLPPKESPLVKALSSLYSDTEVNELYSVIFQ